MVTVRELIIRKIEAKLKEIQKSNGYNMDLGVKVERARISWDQSELPAISVFPEVETAERRYNERITEMPVEIRAYRKITHHNNPSEIAEVMLGDVIINIVGSYFTLDFYNGTKEIKAGDIIEGATSSATAIVLNVRKTNGTWGAGTAKGILTLRYMIGEFQAETLKVIGVNCAQTSGQLIKLNPFTDHVSDIVYINGGVRSYTDTGESTIEVVTRFSFKYSTLNDNPYI